MDGESEVKSEDVEEGVSQGKVQHHKKRAKKRGAGSLSHQPQVGEVR
jgi:hypothetical protein